MTSSSSSPDAAFPSYLPQVIRTYLRESEALAARMVELISPETEYLRSELEEHHRRLHELLSKMDVEDALLRDRDALTDPAPAPGLGELLGHDGK